MVWSCWYSDKIKAKLPSYPLVKTEELVWSGKRWDSDGLLRGSNYANLFYHEKYRIYQLYVQIFSHLHVLAWSNLISVSFILLLHIKIVHSILEMFNFLLWKSICISILYCRLYFSALKCFVNSHKKIILSPKYSRI